ncbi:hypothetical protein F5J12DRAFT_678910, partial [Pisolithus orientalis]|uniref:uncharacterized protein n=1 Tax=Pisolithus orientalis TaxID=936130 RepID=UPI00222434C8
WGEFYLQVGNNTLSQWILVTPNLREQVGGRDTDAVSISDWSSFRLLPLLQDPNFNTSKTLILVTFDES